VKSRAVPVTAEPLRPPNRDLAQGIKTPSVQPAAFLEGSPQRRNGVCQLEDRADFEPQHGRLRTLDTQDLIPRMRPNQTAVVREGQKAVFVNEALSKGDKKIGP
jgi:hypothetical protein